QDLLLTPLMIRETCDEFGLQVQQKEIDEICSTPDQFCEALLKHIGAVTVDSLDASDFEGATIIHDLNRPLPATLHGRFDVVFDGGTLEHVFNFPVALKECMALPRVGGHFLMCSPANNQMGHGFYQFSPELFWRVFSPNNGYELKALFMVPAFSEGQWY